jgi:hypothetical protein
MSTRTEIGLDCWSHLADGDPVEETSKLGWVMDLPAGTPDREVLAELVEADHDEFETQLYEAFADPEFVAIDREKRRYRGQFMRRLRHRSVRS